MPHQAPDDALRNISKACELSSEASRREEVLRGRGKTSPASAAHFQSFLLPTYLPLALVPCALPRTRCFQSFHSRQQSGRGSPLPSFLSHPVIALSVCFSRVCLRSGEARILHRYYHGMNLRSKLCGLRRSPLFNHLILKLL